MDASAVSLDVQADISTLTIGDKAFKVKLPRGERGAPGRATASVSRATRERRARWDAMVFRVGTASCRVRRVRKVILGV
jgi:hypothetical protein